jgi:hypothetical protein
MWPSRPRNRPYGELHAKRNRPYGELHAKRRRERRVAEATFLGVGCSVTLNGNNVSLGSPEKPDRRGPATRTLLRWLDAADMILRE